MDTIDNKSVSPSKVQQLVNAIWPLIDTRSKRIIGLLIIVALGMYLNWGWFVAIGIAPLVLGVLPCAAMCALGLCMGHGKNTSCSTKTQQSDSSDDTNI